MPKVEIQTRNLPVACFAPPLTDELLASYRQLADSLPDSRGDVRDALRECLAAVDLWWSLPVSEGHRRDPRMALTHKGVEKEITVTSLTPDLVKRLWDAVPWPYELDAIQSLFDAIPEAEKALRDAAFHLLWHARELCLDREPLTLDKL